MIDNFSIVSFGGVVLFKSNATESTDLDGKRRSAINHLIQEVLLEDRAGEEEAIVDDYKMRWSLANDAQYFVVALYKKNFSLFLIDSFINDVKMAFSEAFSPKGTPITPELFMTRNYQQEFEETYQRMKSSYEDSERETAAAGTSMIQPSPNVIPVTSSVNRELSCDNEQSFQTVSEAKHTEVTSNNKTLQKNGNFVTASGRVILKKGGSVPVTTSASTNASQPPGKTKGKKPERFDAKKNSNIVVDHTAATSTNSVSTAEEMEKVVENQRKIFIKREKDGSVSKIEERNWQKPPARGIVASWLRSHFGAREIDDQDFEIVIPKLRDKLIGKNVAVEVADDVCKSVRTTLSSTKLGTFASLDATIEKALIEALGRIMRPKREINILRDVASAKARRKPFSIVLCGVNGVGKSTSLAKMTYWLQQNDYSVLIAAGDTFRHGAVEQLEVHGRCLNTPVFQQGYGSDPSDVAKSAVMHAAKSKIDVVLIDTAGRMQDHESRMRALAKLIHDNQPDLVLFVGEALVGNNGIDQLRKFNQCLKDFTPVGLPTRGIDGLIITKFDTIDDKVGAAVSMVYELGQPIVFVGVGQTYQDLKVMEEDVVVSALMS
eukprot:Tbor_TRINITY_DN3624_c0_g1::TRINITY_DN3624_c0_g1_i1::g.319::m.319/K13431/SRPR; signal recognition particle receptor subunit alpha